jgi:hypothetical protein
MVENSQAPAEVDHRSYVGPVERYSNMAANQFMLLVALGLKEHNKLLDIGCGCLRGGKLLIPYLGGGCYTGLEPNEWLVEQGFEHELGRSIIEVKRPRFSARGDFALSMLGETFDFILAQSILSHAGRQQVATLLTEAAVVMHDRSLLVANYLQGETDHVGDDWTYPKNVRYTKAYMERTATEAGLRIIQIAWPHPKLTWFVATLPGGLARAQELIETLPNWPEENALLRTR